MPVVSIDGEQKTYTLDKNEIIYHGLERQGLDLPHGCLAGSCSACRIEILKGENNLSEIGAIEQNTLEALKKQLDKIHGEGFSEGKTFRLACRAHVTGDINLRPVK